MLSKVCITSIEEAPDIQPQISDTSFLNSSGNSAVATISDIARRPPGFKTLYASLNTFYFSGDKLITQLEIITSIVASATGKCSISPRRNSVFVYFPFIALFQAFEIISGVISTPITFPVSPIHD